MATVVLDRLRKVYPDGHVAVAGASFEAADGELLVCEPAKVLPMAQRYFLF